MKGYNRTCKTLPFILLDAARALVAIVLVVLVVELIVVGVEKGGGEVHKARGLLRSFTPWQISFPVAPGSRLLVQKGL